MIDGWLLPFKHFIGGILIKSGLRYSVVEIASMLESKISLAVW